MSKTRRYSVDEPMFDTSIYTGRLANFFLMFNPLNAFNTAESIYKMRDAIEAQRILEADLKVQGKECVLEEAEI